MSLSTYKRTHTIEINSLYIEQANFDLKPYFINCSIFEDIFTHFMTATLTILDPIALTEQIPITGWQKVVITFKSNKDGEFEYFSKEFRIYKLAKKENDTSSGMKNRAYTIHLISEPAKKDMEIRVSRSFKDKKESDVVQNVCQNILGITNLNIEATKYTRTFVCPNWSPTEVIDYMCKTAVRPGAYEAANYVFYEDIDQFNFVSMDSLVEQEPLEPPLTHEVAATYKADMNSSTRQASSYVSDQDFDYIKNAKSGAWGTQFFGIDYFNKDWEKFDYVYSSEFDSQVKIDGSNQKLTDNTIETPEQRVIVGPYMKDPKGYNCDFAKKHVHKRRGMMQLWDNYIHEIEVDGDTRLKVGKKIEFQLPAYNSHEGETQRLDKFLSGYYIITGIHHYFSADQHHQVLTLRKPMLKAGGEQ
jgi:hypothetical protein